MVAVVGETSQSMESVVLCHLWWCEKLLEAKKEAV